MAQETPAPKQTSERAPVVFARVQFQAAASHTTQSITVSSTGSTYRETHRS